jgi:hypothetical protein
VAVSAAYLIADAYFAQNQSKCGILRDVSFFFLDKKETKNQGFRKKAKIFMVKLHRKSLKPGV